MLHCAQNDMEIRQMLSSLLSGPHIFRPTGDQLHPYFLPSMNEKIILDTSDLVIQEKIEGETVYKHYRVDSESDETLDPVIFRRHKSEAGTRLIIFSDPLYPLGSGPFIYLLKVDLPTANRLPRNKYLYKKFHVGLDCIGYMLLVLSGLSPYPCMVGVFCTNPSFRNFGISSQEYVVVAPGGLNLHKKVEEEGTIPTERIQNFTEVVDTYQDDIEKGNGAGGENVNAIQIPIPPNVDDKRMRTHPHPFQDFVLLQNISNVQTLKSNDKSKLFNKTQPFLRTVTLPSVEEATTTSTSVVNNVIGNTLPRPSSQRSMATDQIKNSTFIECEVPLKEEGIDNTLAMSTAPTTTISSKTDEVKLSDNYRGGNISDRDNTNNMVKNGFKFEKERVNTIVNDKTGKQAFNNDKNTSNHIQDVRINQSNGNSTYFSEENAPQISFLMEQRGPVNAIITESETLKKDNTNNKFKDVSIASAEEATTTSVDRDVIGSTLNRSSQRSMVLEQIKNSTFVEDKVPLKEEEFHITLAITTESTTTISSIIDEEMLSDNYRGGNISDVDNTNNVSTNNKFKDVSIDQLNDNSTYSTEDGDALETKVLKQQFNLNPIKANTPDSEAWRNEENISNTFEDAGIEKINDSRTNLVEDDASQINHFLSEEKFSPVPDPESESIKNAKHTSNYSEDVRIPQSNSISISTTYLMDDSAPQRNTLIKQFSPDSDIGITADRKTLINEENLSNNYEDVIVGKSNYERAASMDNNVAQMNFAGASNVHIPSTTFQKPETPYNLQSIPYQAGYNTPFNIVATANGAVDKPMRTVNANTFPNSWNTDLPSPNIGNGNNGGYNYNNNDPWKNTGIQNNGPFSPFYSGQGRASNRPHNNIAAPQLPITQNMMPSRNFPVGPGIGADARQWSGGNKMLIDSNRNNPRPGVFPGMGVMSDPVRTNVNQQRFYYPNNGGGLNPPFANLGMRNS
ncbi:unnamed protein product [Orchesella dallaii]|uniref:Uncharacterized protein n=1 Tax=Orchesella dallaii TaxID=48710 RepID=A0ABP1PXB3_9HEXA